MLGGWAEEGCGSVDVSRSEEGEERRKGKWMRLVESTRREDGLVWRRAAVEGAER
jgi:hypothetical protein